MNIEEWFLNTVYNKTTMFCQGVSPEVNSKILSEKVEKKSATGCALYLFTVVIPSNFSFGAANKNCFAPMTHF